MSSGFGYAGQILKVDLSNGRMVNLPTGGYASRFLGGRGVAARIYWDEALPQVKALAPENPLILVNGPLAGLPRLAGSRWQICGKSPTTTPGFFSYANLGGSWGAWLKFAGYDGVVVQGKSEKPVYLLVRNGVAEIKDASFLWGKGAIETREILKKALGEDTRLVAIGPAGENLVTFATVLADDDTSGSGGFGAVMGSKKLKAIAVWGNKKPVPSKPEKLQELTRYLVGTRKGTWDTQILVIPGKRKKRACYGCITGCARQTYQTSDGEQRKFMCQSGAVYIGPARRYYGESNEVPYLANRLCDDLGLNTEVVYPMVTWLFRCHRDGILTEENTGIPLSKSGSLEFIETLTRKIAFREGFGDVLALGTFAAADQVGRGARELVGDSIVHESNEMTSYDPRLYITTGLLYATEPRKPLGQIHAVGQTAMRWVEWVNKEEGAYFSTEAFRTVARRFWGGEMAADFSTYQGKSLAAKKIQDREYVKESLILCDFSWPVLWVKCSEDHAGDPSLESKVFSAVTGIETGEEELNLVGERVFNLQRAILTREGRQGRESDKLLEVFHTAPLRVDYHNRECLVPGKEGETISRRGTVVDRGEFEKMKDEYYALRGWDVASGLQKRGKLKEIGLGDIIEPLGEKGLVR